MRDRNSTTYPADGVARCVASVLIDHIAGGNPVKTVSVDTDVAESTLRRMMTADANDMTLSNYTLLVRGLPKDVSLAMQAYVSGPDFIHTPRKQLDGDLNNDGVVDHRDAFKAVGRWCEKHGELMATVQRVSDDNKVSDDEMIEVLRRLQEYRHCEQEGHQVMVEMNGNNGRRKARAM